MIALARILSVAALTLVAISQGGCLLVAAAAGTGATVAYVRGDTDTTVDATPEQVAAAAERAMHDLQVAVISREAGKLDSKVTGRTARDTRLLVSSKAGVNGTSMVSVRVGTFGDNALQAQLLEKIRAHLAQERAASAGLTPATQPVVTDAK